MADKLPPLPDGYKRVGVDLPPSVIAIIRAAGGEENMPRAMASIVGALPWISRALFNALPADEYRAYAAGLTANAQAAIDIANAHDVEAAFLDMFERAKRAVN